MASGWGMYVVTVGTTSSMHLLIKTVTDMVYSSMSSEESREHVPFCATKQSCSLASASSDHLFIDRVTGASCLNCLLESRNQEDRVVVGFTKWRARESSVCVSVCGV